jgi:hypothetical protein
MIAFADSWLRRLLILDVAVCLSFSIQLLLFPKSFLSSAFDEFNYSGELRDMLRLFGGIYLSWTIMLIYLVQIPKSRKLCVFLLISSCAQLPLSSLLESVTMQFQLINTVALIFWCVSYAFLALFGAFSK